MPFVIVKNKIWPIIQYDPHDGQRMIHENTARHRVASCGRRFGKSTVGGNELIPEAAYTYSLLPALEQIAKPRKFWLVGPDYTDGEKEFRVLYNNMKKMQFPFDKPGTYNSPLSGDMHISLFKGYYTVDVKSARYQDSLDGEGLSGVELVEAAKLKPSVWAKFIRPALADESGWSLQTSTPEGKNWFYRHWQWGQDPTRTSWASWRMPAWVNNYIYPKGREDQEISDLRAELTEAMFEQEIEALFTEFTGRVFKEFDEEIHVVDLKYDPTKPLYAGVDYGWTNPFVWLAIQMDVFENVYVIGEYRAREKDTEVIAKELMEWPLGRNVNTIFPDPAEPDDTSILKRHLHCNVNYNTGGTLKWRLELIRKWLKFDPVSEGHPDDVRKPKLFIDRSCVGLIDEMTDKYRYPETREESLRANKEEPLDKDNHGPEALGRFFRGMFGGPGGPVERARARMSRVRVST